MAWFPCCCSCDAACNDADTLSTANAVIGEDTFNFTFPVRDNFICSDVAYDCISESPVSVFTSDCEGPWNDLDIPLVVCGCVGSEDGPGGPGGGGPGIDPECPPGEDCEPCTTFGPAVNYTQFQFSSKTRWKHRNWRHLRKLVQLRVMPGDTPGTVLVSVWMWFSLTDIWNYSTQLCTRTRDIYRVCGVDPVTGAQRSDYTLGPWVEDTCTPAGEVPLPCTWPQPSPLPLSVTEFAGCFESNQPGVCNPVPFENRNWQTVICNSETCTYQIVNTTVQRLLPLVGLRGFDETCANWLPVPNCVGASLPNCSLYRDSQVIAGPSGIIGAGPTIWVPLEWLSEEVDCHTLRTSPITLTRSNTNITTDVTLTSPARTGTCCGTTQTIPAQDFLTVPYSITVDFT